MPQARNKRHSCATRADGSDALPDGGHDNGINDANVPCKRAKLDEDIVEDMNISDEDADASAYGSDSDMEDESSSGEVDSQSDGSQTESSQSSPSYLLVEQYGKNWSGIGSFQTIVVFGDSYSDPTPPDDCSFTWVEHMVDLLCDRYAKYPTVRNFAFPGATAERHLTRQRRCFLAKPRRSSGGIWNHSKHPKLNHYGDGYPPYGPSATYVIFMGINDCGTIGGSEIEDAIEVVFDTVHKLYTRARARNFLLVDVPPINHSPSAVQLDASDLARERVEEWNRLLVSRASDFAQETPRATVLLFSVHTLLTTILGNPSEYGFAEEDIEEKGGGIWEDGLHLTTEVHEIFAEKVLEALHL